MASITCRLIFISYLLLIIFSTCFSSRLLGGWETATPGHTGVQRVAGQAVSKLGENGDIVEICEAKTQVVAGVNYDISMIIKDKGNSDGSTNQYCTFHAYERAWEKFLDIKNMSCDKSQKSCPKKQEN